MKALNLKIKDEYFDRIVSFLELLPKNSIVIEKDSKQQKLDEIKKEAIKEAENMLKSGNFKVFNSLEEYKKAMDV